MSGLTVNLHNTLKCVPRQAKQTNGFNDLLAVTSWLFLAQCKIPTDKMILSYIWRGIFTSIAEHWRLYSLDLSEYLKRKS